MLKIRLSRRGKKKQPSYRVVVADINAKRDGRIVELIGHYNPLTNPSEFSIKEDRALHWLSVGAQPTDAVRRLLDKQGTFDRLGRMRAGESLETLAAEVMGEAAAAPEAVEEEQTVVEKVVETVQEVVSDAAETVEDAVASVVETVEEVVSDVTEDDAEEATEESESETEDVPDSDESEEAETEEEDSGEKDSGEKDSGEENSGEEDAAEEDASGDEAVDDASAEEDA